MDYLDLATRLGDDAAGADRATDLLGMLRGAELDAWPWMGRALTVDEIRKDWTPTGRKVA